MTHGDKAPISRRLLFAATIAVFQILVMTAGGCNSMEPEHTFSRIEFAGATIEVRYVEVTGAAAFASHTVRFYEVKDGRDRLLLQTVLRNDGKNPTEKNIEFLRNEDGTMKLILRGDEQPDAGYRITSDHGAVIVEKESLP